MPKILTDTDNTVIRLKDGVVSHGKISVSYVPKTSSRKLIVKSLDSECHEQEV